MKRLHILVLAAAVAALVLAFPGAAFANSYTGSSDWSVTYTSAGEMTDTYSAKSFADDVKDLQPGDDITFTVKLNHDNSKSAAWYMNNEVIKSLEAGSASGSAYEYELTYTGASSSSSRTLYSSQKVGGDDSGKGLVDATEAGGLEDFFFLETLSKGDAGTVTLKVTLDGETEGNAYFDTLAQLKMQFGVDPTQETTTTVTKTKKVPGKTTTVVRTGDDTNLFPFYMIMVVSGLALLVLAIASIRRRRQDKTVGSHMR